MLKAVFLELDDQISVYNSATREEGYVRLGQSIFKVLGQSALFEANFGIELRVTHDVDAYVQANHWVVEKFNELLAKIGKHYDIHSDEIWMPAETIYEPLYTGVNLQASIAQPEFVMISKALKAPEKNRDLLANYIKSEATDIFFELAIKYKLDIDKVLK